MKKNLWSSPAIQKLHFINCPPKTSTTKSHLFYLSGFGPFLVYEVGSRCFPQRSLCHCNALRRGSLQWEAHCGGVLCRLV
uniref:Uncharacterized protein n=1 Tax=Glycine max TaxID=3847 RepID=C6T127_SOYBN|nr:unknown [Glycine max]